MSMIVRHGMVPFVAEVLPHLQVKPELAAVSKVDDSVESFARSNYEVSCEVALNEQVNSTTM